MTGSWTWDESLYAGSAAYYAAGRMQYPEALAARIGDEVGLTGREQALDVGCGPGSLTLLLARYVGHIVGIDADREMIEQARSAAARAQVTNASWRCMLAEQLPADLGPMDLVTFAQSFHWMDRLSVARRVREMLTDGGSCVHVHATTHRGDSSVDRLSHPRPPYDEIDQLVRSYLGPGRRAGRSALPHGTPSGEADIFREAGFGGPVHVEVPRGDVVERTVDEIVAATLSLSSSTPHLFGTALPEFETNLRSLLAAASASGCFSERLRDLAFDVWRPTGS